MSNPLRPAVLIINQDFAGALRLLLKLPPESMGSEKFARFFRWLATQATGPVTVSATEVSLPLMTEMPYPFDTDPLLYKMAKMTESLLGRPVQVLSSDAAVAAYRGTLSFVKYADIAPLLCAYEAETLVQHPLGDAKVH